LLPSAAGRKCVRQGIPGIERLRIPLLIDASWLAQSFLNNHGGDERDEVYRLE
jgi:hypothetical protein